ncbi:sodium:solute symporter family protein [Saccharopolyspora rosea]|uniref:sodium:solute symporter family protein n=1 Tax=Saccharopolyspora rosea TaxID=524884 RepID=UPI0021D94D5C|nr:sodium:solute symporter family protein [Saccharopolyspora rosea]
MSVTLAVSLVGMVVIGVLGFLGRRGRSANLAEWTVGRRSFGTFTMWFLQAGESFTTFTFLAVAGLAFTGGASATYAIPYIPLAYLGLYFLGPKVWRLGKEHHYLTQADFFQERYGSPLLGRVVAVMGVVFLLPYLQLQITGLGLIVKLVTGDASSGVLSMVLATVLTVAFVLWSGIRGVASTAYLKDALMILAIFLVIAVVPVHFAGGVSAVFRRLQQTDPQALFVHTGHYDHTWWLTSILISAIGSMFLTLPHLWPPLLSARDGGVVRRNNIFLPLYQLAIMLPIIIGYTGLLVLPRGTDDNAVLLTLTARALPDWAVGFVAVAAAASAMVPAAVMCMGMSTLVAHNLVRPKGPRAQLWVNHGTVIAAAGLALVLGIVRPDLLANLLLLTFSGLAQLAPGLAAVVGRRRLLSAGPALLGMLAGVAVVAWMTFFEVSIAHINAGIVGLVVNIALAALAQLLVGKPRQVSSWATRRLAAEAAD